MIVEERSTHAREKAGAIAKQVCLSVLREGKSLNLETSTSSMYPFIKAGDTIKVVPAGKDDIKIGDVLAVDLIDEGEAWFYAHRVVDISCNEGIRFFTTKGDAYRAEIDEPVIFDRIAGRIAEVKRDGLKMDMESPLWRRLNAHIAKLSIRHPALLCCMSPFISLLMEWRSLIPKIARRIDRVCCDTEELLLISARTHIGRGLRNRARDLIAEEIDWQLFMDNAMRSSMPFLFYNSLKNIDSSGRIPQEVTESLKKAYLSTIPKIIFMHEESKGVLKGFFKNSIPAVPLKGTFLSSRLYGDIEARGLSADFDLLVKEEDLKGSRQVLEGLGYRASPPAKYTGWNQQPAFTKPRSNAIELHWGIRPDVPNRERTQGLWQGARLKSEDGASFYELADEELLIMLSAHFIGSAHFGQLRYICDINQLLTSSVNTLDWQSIVRKSKRWGLSNAVYATIALSKSLFQTYIPDDAFFELRPGLVKRFFIRLTLNRNSVLRPCSIEARLINLFLKYVLLQVLEASSPKDLFSLFFPKTEMMGGRTYTGRFISALQKLTKLFNKQSRRQIS